MTQFIENRKRYGGINLRGKVVQLQCRASPRRSDDDPIVGGHMLLVAATIGPITMRGLDLAEWRQVLFQRDRQGGTTSDNALEMQLTIRLTYRGCVSTGAWTHKKSS